MLNLFYDTKNKNSRSLYTKRDPLWQNMFHILHESRNYYVELFEWYAETYHSYHIKDVKEIIGVIYREF
jgi:predicted HAD superfamily hydrolase